MTAKRGGTKRGGRKASPIEKPGSAARLREIMETPITDEDLAAAAAAPAPDAPADTSDQPAAAVVGNFAHYAPPEQIVPINQLKPYERNAKKHQETVMQLAPLLREYGQRTPVVVDQEWIIAKGHRTWMAALRLGWTHIWAAVATDLTQDQIDAYRIADNEAAAHSPTDEALLALEAARLSDRGIPAVLLGMGDDELSALLNPKPETEKKEPAGIKPPKDPVTQRGDLWILGRHRLLCGDSTDADDVGRLMGGEFADLVNTDPPYGVDYVDRKPEQRSIKGDQEKGDKLVGLLVPALVQAVAWSRDTAPFYIWHASVTRRDFEWALEAAGLMERQYLTWVKDMIVMGHADYHWQTEPCFYAHKAGHSPTFYGDRTQSTVWRVARTDAEGWRQILIANGLKISDGQGHELYLAPKAPKAKKLRLMRLEDGETAYLVMSEQGTDAWEIAREGRTDYQHPNQKPTALAVRAIENSSRPDDLVLDLFGGGGFTLLGCEATNRRARVMDLDPVWCDVIVDRWQQMTGATAMRA